MMIEIMYFFMILLCLNLNFFFEIYIVVLKKDIKKLELRLIFLYYIFLI